MIRFRLSRIVAAGAVTALALVGLVAAPAHAAQQPLGDPGTVGGHVWLGSHDLSATAGEVRVGLDIYSGSAFVPSGLSALTDAAGDYLITGVTPGVNYYPVADNLGTRPYSLAHYHNNSVQSGGSYYAILDLGYRVSGHVDLGDASHPAGLNEVQVWLSYGTVLSHTRYISTKTDANGDYTFPRIPPDFASFFVEFDYLGTGPWPDWFYTGSAPGSRDNLAAATVSGNADHVVDVTIGQGAGISGRVVDSAGDPIEGVDVDASRRLTSPSAPEGWVYRYTTTTDADGYYSFPGLPVAWKYTLGFTADGYTYARNGGQTIYTCCEYIDISDGTMHDGYDATLYVRATITATHVRGWNPPGGSDFLNWGFELYRQDDATGEWVPQGSTDAMWGIDLQKQHSWDNLTPGTYGVAAAYRGPQGYNSGALVTVVLPEGAEKTAFPYVNQPGTTSALANLADATTDKGAKVGNLSTSSLKGGGWFQRYQNGIAYASKLYGSWWVPAGSLADRHALTGGLAGRLGWPAGLAFCDSAGGCKQRFQGGSLGIPTKVAPEHDLTHDGIPDVLARNPAGQLVVYPGQGDGTIGAAVVLSANWKSFNLSVEAGDVTGDGYGDVIARDSAGTLWVYKGLSTGRLGTKVKYATGFLTRSYLFDAGDMNGDGWTDLVSRDSAGVLRLHRGTGASGFSSVTLATGWQKMTAILAPGDFDGDEKNDIVARDAAGVLWLYPGDGAGHLLPRVQIATGWQTMSFVNAAGDVDGDGDGDLLVRSISGAVFVYFANGDGSLGDHLQIGSTGWKTFQLAR